MNKLTYVFAVCLSMFAIGSAYADDRFECGQHMIHIGDERSEVLEHCGQPTTEAGATWTYDRGSEYLPVTVHFEPDGTVGRIQEGDTM
jgi:hypothetical protein